MVEKYFTLKLIGEAAIIGFFIMVFTILLSMGVVQNIKWKRKVKLLKDNGFERYLHSARSIYGGPTYEWQRKLDGMTFLESEIERYSYKTLKELVE